MAKTDVILLKPVEHLGYKILAFVQAGGGQRKPAAATFDI